MQYVSIVPDLKDYNELGHTTLLKYNDDIAMYITARFLVEGYTTLLDLNKKVKDFQQRDVDEMVKSIKDDTSKKWGEYPTPTIAAKAIEFVIRYSIENGGKMPSADHDKVKHRPYPVIICSLCRTDIRGMDKPVYVDQVGETARELRASTIGKEGDDDVTTRGSRRVSGADVVRRSIARVAVEKFPIEVRRAFRTKAVGISAAQTTVVCGVTMALDWIFNYESHKAIGWIMALGGFFGTLAALPVGWYLRNSYPYNYVGQLIACVTMGLFWAGCDFVIFWDHMNICAQNLSVVAITLWFFVLICQIPLGPKLEAVEGYFLIFMGLLGWMVGSVGNFLIVLTMPNIPEHAINLPALMTLFVLLTSSVITGRQILIGDPEDFFYVVYILQLNCLLVMIIPVLIFLLFFNSPKGTEAKEVNTEEERKKRSTAVGMSFSGKMEVIQDDNAPAGKGSATV